MKVLIFDRKYGDLHITLRGKFFKKTPSSLKLFSYFMVTWFAHTAEIPGEYKERAWIKAQEGFNKFLESFSIHISKNDTLKQKLLMSNIEEQDITKP